VSIAGTQSRETRTFMTQRDTEAKALEEKQKVVAIYAVMKNEPILLSAVVTADDKKSAQPVCRVDRQGLMWHPCGVMNSKRFVLLVLLGQPSAGGCNYVPPPLPHHLPHPPHLPVPPLP